MGYLSAFTRIRILLKKKLSRTILKKRLPSDLNDVIDHLKTFLGEAIDDDILPIIDRRSFEQSVEPYNKFCPQFRREMFVTNGDFLFWHRTIDSLGGLTSQGLCAGIPDGFIL